MDDFTQRVLYDYYAKRSPIDTVQEYAANKTQQVLLEAAAIWVMIQAAVAEDLLNEPQVELWGMQNFDDWELMNNNQKVNQILMLWNQEGATREARNYINKHPKAEPLDPGFWVYDIKDVSVPYDAEIDEHRRQLKESEAFKGLKELLLSYLVRHIDKVPR